MRAADAALQNGCEPSTFHVLASHGSGFADPDQPDNTMNLPATFPPSVRRSKIASRPSIIEPLESRIAPSTLTFSPVLLGYTPTAGVANNFTINIVGANYTFNDTAENITCP